MAKRVSKDTFYTREEVENHNKDGDLWLIIDCVVYDVSNWIEKHPGTGLFVSDVFKLIQSFVNYLPLSRLNFF